MYRWRDFGARSVWQGNRDITRRCYYEDDSFPGILIYFIPPEFVQLQLHYRDQMARDSWLP
jgi:hypothetical protein